MYAAARHATFRSDNPGAGSKTSSALNLYRNEQLLHLTPIEVIHKLYAIAIVACKKNDKGLAQRALNELIAALNFDQKELALGLYRLYDYCKQCIRRDDMDEAVRILDDLRTTWAQAFNLSQDR